MAYLSLIHLLGPNNLFSSRFKNIFTIFGNFEICSRIHVCCTLYYFNHHSAIYNKVRPSVWQPTSIYWILILGGWTTLLFFYNHYPKHSIIHIACVVAVTQNAYNTNINSYLKGVIVKVAFPYLT